MNLQELEQKYQELGQEIERLKSNEIKYPIYCRNKMTGLIVKFYGIDSGKIVKQDNQYDVGNDRIFWANHTNIDIWQQLEVCPETGLFDGQLVWVWDNHRRHQRILTFYDAWYKRAFDSQGERDGDRWDNYEPYEGNWPDWAQESFKTLQR